MWLLGSVDRRLGASSTSTLNSQYSYELHTFRIHTTFEFLLIVAFTKDTSSSTLQAIIPLRSSKNCLRSVRDLAPLRTGKSQRKCLRAITTIRVVGNNRSRGMIPWRPVSLTNCCNPICIRTRLVQNLPRPDFVVGKPILLDLVRCESSSSEVCGCM